MYQQEANPEATPVEPPSPVPPAEPSPEVPVEPIPDEAAPTDP